MSTPLKEGKWEVKIMENFKIEVAVTVDLSDSVKVFLRNLLGASGNVPAVVNEAKTEVQTKTNDPQAEETQTAAAEPQADNNTNILQHWSKDDVICVLRNIGKDKAKNVLEHFNVPNVSGLTADKYGEVIDYAKGV